jgi:ABC-type transport system involved in cytochrome bd biosynthesis fused ATPase/permease subunit
MIRDKDIYVFDEITSNLDEETEKDIIDLIFSIAKKKTFIIISHKKEILKKVDRIYEMKNGKLI